MDVFRDINWFVVHTKARQEDLAAVYIRRLGVQVYLPKVLRGGLHGKSQLLRKPLFPGYVFAQFSPCSYLHQVRYARGVRRVVSAGETPLPVSEEIVHALRLRVGEEHCDINSDSLTLGDRVEVTTGLLRGLKGLFEMELSDRQRVVLLLETVAYQARVFIEKRCLTPG